jgi:Putative peptidoglycan binding domain
MKTFLLPIFALAIAAGPVLGEDQDQPKPPKSRPQTAPPQRQVNTAPRPVAPRVHNNTPANPQFQPRYKPAVPNRTYVPKTYSPKTYTPNVPARTFTPPNQDAPRNSTVNRDTTVANRNWRNRPRTNPNVVTPQTPNTTVQSNTNVRNRDWQNRTDRNRNWQNNNSTGTFTYEQARSRFNRQHHDRSWWRSRYNRIVLFGGGYYYWDNNYWYPAYGYDPYYSTYAYDEPIYGYDNLPPGQVIANVQSALQEQGYYRDAVDGLIGPNTRAAISNFQRDRGLPVTAAIDGPTLQALGLD